MKSTKLQKRYLDDLKFIFKLLKDYSPFVFYGTLLGITRENNLIKGDDDIDILININYKKEVISILKNTESFKQSKGITNDYFTQFINNKDNIKTLIDIYFYIDQKNKDYLIEKHNWLSTINSKKHELHIPKKLVFPLKNIKEYENIVFPNENEKLCRFLYGETWRIKLKKNTGYRMEIVNNKPKLIRRSFLGRLTRIVKSYF